MTAPSGTAETAYRPNPYAQDRPSPILEPEK